jgi:hypothetical protein
MGHGVAASTCCCAAVDPHRFGTSLMNRGGRDEPTAPARRRRLGEVHGTRTYWRGQAREPDARAEQHPPDDDHSDVRAPDDDHVDVCCGASPTRNNVDVAATADGTREKTPDSK